MSTSDRPPVSFVAWTPVGGRSVEVAAALGGEAHCVSLRRWRARRWAPVRYLHATLSTTAYLARRRPAALIVTNPPLLPGLIGWGYSRLVGARLVLDSHPGGFGAQGDNVAANMQWLHRWLARRADLSLVTSERWCRVLSTWGARGAVFHESRPDWTIAPPRTGSPRPTVLFVGVFGGDEPVDAVLGAARMVPDADFLVTGDLRRAPAGITRTAPANVTFTGYLEGDAYRAAVEGADVILTLSTEPTSVMRAAYEAVWARRPLIVSDWPQLRELFPMAVHVRNDAGAVARGVRTARAAHGALVARAETALSLQEQRVDRLEAELRHALWSGPRPGRTGRRRSRRAPTVPVHAGAR